MQEAGRGSSAGLAVAVKAESRQSSAAFEATDRAGGLRRTDTDRPIALVSNNLERDVLVPPMFGRAGAADSAVFDGRGFLASVSASHLSAGWAKRALDLIGAACLALVFFPLVLPIVLIMSLSQGPIIYAHRRVGHGGKIFKCFKFRTMVANADQVLHELLERNPNLKAEWIRDHKLRDDPRVTGIGRFLRRTSLDELPQIWNVFRGEMSLVGPRPVVKEELLRYGRNVSAYFSTKPGITGLWQVSGRNDTDYRRRVAIDVYYVRNQNLLLDLYILFKTTRVVLGGDGAY